MSLSTLVQMHAAHATAAAPTGSITVCVGTLTGLVRIVRPADRCLPLEHKETLQLQGAQGPQGPPGPPGPTPPLNMLGQSCPTGLFVSGFDQAGRILCRATEGTIEPPPNDPPPISLPTLASAVATALRTVSEQTEPFNIQTTQSGISITVGGQLDTAFCSPTDVQTVPPYNCAPQVTGAFEIDSEGAITGSVVFDFMFSRLTANARAEAVGLSADFPISGYLQLQQLRVDLSAQSVLQADGTRRITGFSIIGEGSKSSTGQMKADGVAGAVAGLAEDYLLSFAYNSVLAYVKTALAQKLADVTATLPPVANGP